MTGRRGRAGNGTLAAAVGSASFRDTTRRTPNQDSSNITAARVYAVADGSRFAGASHRR